MKRFKFTIGTITKLTKDYYTLVLYSADNKVIYKATVSRIDAAELIDKSNNIKLVS